MTTYRSSRLRPITNEIEEFSHRRASATRHRPVLATVLFTDIVGSTERAATLGDRAGRDLLEAHHALVRRELAIHRGIEVDTAGDGFMARFDGPARAIRCAQPLLRRCDHSGLRSGAGLHTGECEVWVLTWPVLRCISRLASQRERDQVKCVSPER